MKNFKDSIAVCFILPCFDILYAVQCRALKIIDQLMIWTSTEEKKNQVGKLPKSSYSSGHLLYNHFTHDSISKVEIYRLQQC